MSDGTPRPVRQVSAGTADRAPPSASAIVAGGGLAGVAAATVLAERGVRVAVLESEASLGGRLRTWVERLPDGSELRMERGFHAFFRQYYNLRALLRRVDPELRRLVPLRDYPILAPGGRVQSFESLPTRPPWNFLALIGRGGALRWRDLPRVNAVAALEMLRYHPVRTPARMSGRTAADYLESLRFPSAARRVLFDVFSHSFFNPEGDMSAAELLMMFHFYFMANPEGLVFDVLDDEFESSLWAPLRGYLERLGVVFRLGRRVQALSREPSSGLWSVIHEDAGGADRESISADAVVLAVDVLSLREIVAASPRVGEADWRDRVGALQLTRPFAVWRLWLDRPTRPGRHPFVGTTGYGALDNISLYHLFEAESRAWAERSGGAVVELHAYAVPEGMDESALRAELRAALDELYPETRAADTLHESFLLRRDCPAFPPGTRAGAPGVETPEAGLTLAGDFVKLDFPTALMERAAASGILAANVVLRRWKVRPEPLWSVAPTGPLAFGRPGVRPG